jgi:hypothetical protein
VRRAAFLVSVVVLAACGGSGGGRLSADEYREQADAICAKANDDLRNVEQPQSVDALDDFVDEAKPIVEDAVGELDDLDPPEDLEDAHDRWIGQNKRLLEALDELKNSEQGDIEDKANEFGELNQEANRTARADLGLDECGEE